MLLSWDPNLAQHIPNKIPSDTGMDICPLPRELLLSASPVPPALLIRLHRIQKFFYFTSTVTLAFFIVLLIWASATMGPKGFQLRHFTPR